MRTTKFSAVALSIFLAAVNPSAEAEGVDDSGHWVSAWSTAVHAPLAFPGLPPSPVFEDQTIRMVVRPTIGGERARVRLSNAFGATALTIGAAHIALALEGPNTLPESGRPLTFGGRASVTVPPGAPILSDPVDLKVGAFDEVAVSIYLPASTRASTTHFWAQHETYISGPGDHSAEPAMPSPTTSSSWYWLAAVEVWTSTETAAIVALGDSITDGVGAPQGQYDDWPDLLANRLEHAEGSRLAVVNAGIGGNRILHDGAGASALARFDRDVLAQPGIAGLIVLEGINDIGWPHMKPPAPNGDTVKEPPFAHELVSAEDIIVGLKQAIDRARQHGIRVFGATLTPYEGADYYSTDGEAVRQAVNRWIRTGGAFDAVFDFDAAVRDPDHPSRFREDHHSGDHLHPSAIGYRAMAESIDLTALRGSAGSGRQE